jgi:hypothetical protein
MALWSTTDARTWKEAADQFAREHWPQPRKVRDLRVTTAKDGTQRATFGIVDGSRVYGLAPARLAFGTRFEVSVLA